MTGQAPRHRCCWSWQTHPHPHCTNLMLSTSSRETTQCLCPAQACALPPGCHCCLTGTRRRWGMPGCCPAPPWPWSQCCCHSLRRPAALLAAPPRAAQGQSQVPRRACRRCTSPIEMDKGGTASHQAQRRSHRHTDCTRQHRHFAAGWAGHWLCQVDTPHTAPVDPAPLLGAPPATAQCVTPMPTTALCAGCGH